MIISLIGTSGVGKTYWSSRLEKEADYERICCDELIGKKLAEKVSELKFATDAQSIAKWRGLPYEPKYKQNMELQLQSQQQ
ncbi:MAG: hypothetical protein ACREHG_00195 [Candidatus Saccharimonadales bacterium]